jgi:hypothetical protein
MELFPYERRRLDDLEGALRAEEPSLASKFDLFTRLERPGGLPSAEAQFLAGGPWREAAFARQRLRRHLLVIAAVLLALLAGIIALSLA